MYHYVFIIISVFRVQFLVKLLKYRLYNPYNNANNFFIVVIQRLYDRIDSPQFCFSVIMIGMAATTTSISKTVLALNVMKPPDIFVTNLALDPNFYHVAVGHFWTGQGQPSSFIRKKNFKISNPKYRLL